VSQPDPDPANQLMLKKLFGKKDESSQQTELVRTVARSMPTADEETHRIVAAIAGLLAQVAYADHDYSESERHHLRTELGRIQALSTAGADEIAELLDKRIGEVAAVELPWHARTVRDLCERDFRLHILELLVDLAAADGEVSLAETNLMRHMALSLGLTQQDYNTAQARHRDKLSVLR